MRVISGSLGGQTIKTPHGHKTHPMSEKIRGALFSVLGDIDGLTVLDCFAGSGAVAIEAISRGASLALMIDNDKNAQLTIEQNIKTLAISDKTRLIKANCSSWSDNNSEERFDIVIIDPPYDNVNDSQLLKLAQHTKLAGILIFSIPPTFSLHLDQDVFEILKEKDYGDAKLVFYRRIR